MRSALLYFFHYVRHITEARNGSECTSAVVVDGVCALDTVLLRNMLPYVSCLGRDGRLHLHNSAPSSTIYPLTTTLHGTPTAFPKLLPPRHLAQSTPGVPSPPTPLSPPSPLVPSEGGHVVREEIVHVGLASERCVDDRLELHQRLRVHPLLPRYRPDGRLTRACGVEERGCGKMSDTNGLCLKLHA